MLRQIYIIVGTILNYIALIGWNIRDYIFKPKSNYVLFVAHPDDDALFFHTYIKEYKPYVCLMTTGWSIKRMPDFIRCMKMYGVRYRAYPMKSRDDRMGLLKKHVNRVLRIKKFTTIATHNKSGEYGHIEHKYIHFLLYCVFIQHVLFNLESINWAENRHFSICNT